MAVNFSEKIEPSSIEKKFIDICERVLPEHKFGIYDVRYLTGSSTLRVFITKEGNVTGVGINDCIAVDRLLSPFIDTEEWIPQNFILEVSSPGLYRDIRYKDQLKYSVGELIKVKTNSVPVDPTMKNQNVVGRLIKFDEQEIVLSIADGSSDIVLEYNMIKTANAEVEL